MKSETYILRPEVVSKLSLHIGLLIMKIASILDIYTPR